LNTQTKDDLHRTERLLRHYQADPLQLSSRNPFDDDLSDESIEAFIDRTFEQNPITKDKSFAIPTAHEAFKRLKGYTDTLLSQSTIVEFDNICKILIDPHVKDISPLLCHYDLLTSNTNLQLKARQILELD
jgi:hypothetical protein